MFDATNKPVAVRNFLTNGGGIVSIATHPVDGSLCYVAWTNGIKRMRYGVSGNQPLKAVASVDKTFEPSPLTVWFEGSTNLVDWTIGSWSPQWHPLPARRTLTTPVPAIFASASIARCWRREGLPNARSDDEVGPGQFFAAWARLPHETASFIRHRPTHHYQMKALLLLEDNAERIVAFEEAVRELGDEWQLCVWRDAPTMIAECEECFEDTHLISLDHDLNPQPGATRDPGTGLEVAQFLASHFPFCPVIIHSTNADRAWSMHNDLRFGGWTVERFGPIGEDWFRKIWLPKARELLASSPRQEIFRLPVDHNERMKRTFLSLEGLAIADAVGEMLAYRHYQAPSIIESGLPVGPWFRTDDSEMAISIVEGLNLYGYVHQDALARRFAWRYEREPDRGYGSMTRAQLNEINKGGDWRQGAASAFGGQGSMGNGGAMRVAPIGGYFADNLQRAADEARASALVTHTHPEGVAGAIAVAVAAAVAWCSRRRSTDQRTKQLFDAVLEFTPESKVRRGIRLAAETPPNLEVEAVAKALGNGSLVTAPDTVPFTIWCAANHLDDYVAAVKQTIVAGGDCDTNAAIVGGIVALSAGRESIPADWRQQKEPLPFKSIQ